MSKRLQVVLAEDEFERFRAAAEHSNLTLSEWARAALRDATRRTAEGDPDKRIEAIRRATLHSFPAPDIDQMLQEIESGYSGPS
jgi:hypothetical protein